MRLVVVVIVALAACSSSSSTSKQPDAGSTADAYVTKCGAPGDVGNELGIGKFCASIGDCSGTQSAPLCSSLGDKDTHFCTRTCTMGSTTDCGTGATCTCNSSNQCGCTPNTCL